MEFITTFFDLYIKVLGYLILAIVGGLFLFAIITGPSTEKMKYAKWVNKQTEWLKEVTNGYGDRIICIDIETTGLEPYYDEILQVSVINGNGTILFDELIKPKQRRSWVEAESINGIRPIDVKNKLPISAHQATIQKILDDSLVIVGYNLVGYDLKFLIAADIDTGSQLFVDVMYNFSIVFGEWSSKFNNYKFQKLETCAKYYGYRDFQKHRSLEDVKATLFCFLQMLKKNQIKEINYKDDGRKR